jgi:hypothetical protein
LTGASFTYINPGKPCLVGLGRSPTRQFSATDGRPLGILATLHYRQGAITGWPDVLWSNPSGSQLIISTTRLSAAPSKNGDLTPEEIGTVSGGRFAPLPGIPGGQRPVW